MLKLTIPSLIFISCLSSCFAQNTFILKSLKKTSTLESSQFATVRALPIFYESLEEHDYEIYELIIDYTEPTFSQLQAVKDSLGDNPYNLLYEQIKIHHIFLKALQIQNILKEIDFLSKIIPYSADYSSNTTILKYIGSQFSSTFVQDSILTRSYFNDVSGLLATLKTKYDPFNTKLNVFHGRDEIKKLVNYKFEGTDSAQKKYWNTIITLNKSELPILIKSCNDFIKHNYSNFKDLSDYLKSKYPELPHLLNQ